METLISVIVPVYNVKQYLDDCVQSLLMQTYPHVEIILVDDGSVDGSGQMCDTYAQAHENITVVHKENGGLSSARNAGLEVARGAYVLFVDSDDYCAVQMLEILYAGMQQRKDVDVVVGNVSRVSFDSHFSEADMSEVENPTFEYYSRMEAYRALYAGKKLSWIACGALYRRKIFESLRFENVILEDVLIRPHVFAQTEYVAYTSAQLYAYRISPGSIITKGASLRKFADSMYVYTKNVEFFKANSKEMYYRAQDMLCSSLLNWYLKAKQGDAENLVEYKRRIRKLLCKNICSFCVNPYIQLKRKIIAVLAIAHFKFLDLYSRRMK